MKAEVHLYYTSRSYIPLYSVIKIDGHLCASITGGKLRTLVCAVHLEIGKRQPCSMLFIYWKNAILEPLKGFIQPTVEVN